MASFLTPLDVRDLSGEKPRFGLLSPLEFRSDILGKVVRVPTGFITDFASIPHVLWNILPPVGSYDAAGVVHDYLYRFNGCTRLQADQVLREGMFVVQTPAWKRAMIYLGVRAGCGPVWGRYRKQGLKDAS